MDGEPKMFIKIEAALNSPLMIGGKTLNTNYKESRAYIPGSVLRAAYARAIIERCPHIHKNYWLEYKDGPECSKCNFKAVCRGFPDITFPALYPLGGAPFPMTARKEKYGQEGGKKIMDIARCRLKHHGKMEGESSWERLEGFHKDGKIIEAIHTLVTRTAVDYKRCAARQGALYSQNAVSEVFFDKTTEKQEKAVFSGITWVDPAMKEELDNIKALRIGADLTRGMGQCSISYQETNAPDTLGNLDERVRSFNAGNDGEEFFLTADLLTDAYLSLEKMGGDDGSPAAIGDEQFRAFLEKEIGLPGCCRLVKAYKTQEVLKGFNTAKETEQDMRRKGRLVIRAGAVFIYKASRADYDAKALLRLEEQGIGEHREHGFGRIQICDAFHIDYDVLKGDGQDG